MQYAVGMQCAVFAQYAVGVRLLCPHAVDAVGTQYAVGFGAKKSLYPMQWTQWTQ